MDKKSQSNLHNEWFNARSQADCTLQILCFEYEEDYFEDMSISDGSPLYCIFQSLGDEHRYIPRSLDDRYVIFNVLDLDNDFGLFRKSDWTIQISTEHATEKETILHEMIHFYEASLDCINPSLNQFLLLYLYEKLLPQIPDLKDRIIKNADMLSLEDLESTGGSHDILFQLKSYDLDLRCGFKLGTVFGYEGYLE